eukprot:7830121-Pyramimonas_sp.AAC.1
MDVCDVGGKGAMCRRFMFDALLMLIIIIIIKGHATPIRRCGHCAHVHASRGPQSAGTHSGGAVGEGLRHPRGCASVAHPELGHKRVAHNRHGD